MKKREDDVNSKERLEAAVNGEKADRVGWAPEINDQVTERHIEGVRSGKMEPYVPVERPNALPYAFSNQIVGGDTLLRVRPYRVEYDDVRFESLEEGDERIDTVETPKGKLVSRVRVNPENVTSFRYEHFIKGPDDYAIWADVVEHTRYVENYESVLEIERKLDGDGMITIETPCSPYMDFVMWHAGVEPLMYQIFDHEKALTDLFERQHAKNLEAYAIAVKAPLSTKVVRPIEDTSQHLSSPPMFRKFIERHMRDYGEAVRGAGRLFVPHMCGHLADILPILVDMPIDGIEAITPPPTGNCPVTLARRVLGPGRLLIGGIDPTRYALCEPGEFERIVRDVLDAMKDDVRFVLGHEEIQVTARPENIRTVIRLLEETRTG